MKFLIENWYLVLAALVSGILLLWPAIRRTASGSALSTAQAVLLINREKAVLIDVCEPAEYAAGHAVGARNVPLGSIESSKNLPSNKSLPLIVMCATGARAQRAAAALRKLGFEKAQALEGGLAAWRNANLPVEKTAAA